MKNFPFYKQYDSMQCGIACLQMVCKFYGKEISLDQLSQCCHATTEGVSLLGISKAANILGFQTIGKQIGIEEVCSSIPCILYWNQNHFVVLYRIKRKKVSKYYIADPSKGLLVYAEEEFRRHWLNSKYQGKNVGVALFLQPSNRFYEQKIEDRYKKSSFHFLFNYVKQYRCYFGQVFLGALLGCLLQLVFPFLTQAIVDIGIKQQNLKFIYLVLVGQLVLTISRTAIDFVRRWILLHISMRINIFLVSDFFIKLLKLPMSFFDTKLMGDLLQRMNDHGRVETFLTTQMLEVTFSFLSFVVFGCVLFYYNLTIFLIFFFASLFYGLWIGLFLKQRKLLDYELFDKQSENNSKTYQFITTMQEIKLQNCEQRRRWEWEDTQADLFTVRMKSLKLQQTQEAGAILINEAKNILITVLAATSVINGQMTLGAMLAVQYIIGQLNSPIEQFMSFIYSLQDVKISLERINEIHEGKDEESQMYQAKKFGFDKSIRIENIDFKYDPHALKNTLEGISFDIPEGKVTAIVGASGSGKTTLIKLMLGYYKVTCGTIKIARKNINEYNVKWWRRHCGVVMQNGVIFSESLARNIAVDDGKIDIERLEMAAKIANIHDYIMELPLKYNTKIGHDGVGLSQGQKQRILIARAVYKNPDFIFLDEATNSLDAKNERAIVENLENFYKGRTVVLVAHRLSTVKNADQIIVLEGGKVAEIGTHASLVKRKGVYYNLVKNQLELGS